MYMGQYFIVAKKTKQEYFASWAIGGTAKLWEWCASVQAGAFPYLLRKSDQTGGGDVSDLDKAVYAGRWAGDEVYLVGDYYSSDLYITALQSYTDIAKPLVEEYNQFIQVDKLKLQYSKPDC